MDDVVYQENRLCLINCSWIERFYRVEELICDFTGWRNTWMMWYIKKMRVVSNHFVASHLRAYM